MRFTVVIFVLAFALVVADGNKRCGSSEECEQDECCMVRGVLGFWKGDCQKLAKEGETCNQKDASVKVVHGDQYILFCPCESGFQCEVTKVKELPIIGNVTIEQKCTKSTL